MAKKGEEIPFGALVGFKPSEARGEKREKFEPRGETGIFAGYVLSTGMHWANKYRAWALTAFAGAELNIKKAKVPPRLRLRLPVPSHPHPPTHTPTHPTHPRTHPPTPTHPHTHAPAHPPTHPPTHPSVYLHACARACVHACVFLRAFARVRARAVVRAVLSGARAGAPHRSHTQSQSHEDCIPGISAPQERVENEEALCDVFHTVAAAQLSQKPRSLDCKHARNVRPPPTLTLRGNFEGLGMQGMLVMQECWGCW